MRFRGHRDGEIVYLGNHEAFGYREVKGGDIDQEKQEGDG